MTDFSQGYSATWEVREVNQDTWDDSDAIGGIREVSITRDCTDDVPLLETGSITLDADSFDWAWCRVYMVADQGGKERHAMATLLFERVSSRFVMMVV